MNAEDKAKAQELYANLGLNLTTVINLLLRQTVVTGTLPIKVSALEDVIEAREDALNNRHLEHF